MYVRRPEYFIAAVLFGVLAVAASVITAISLDTGISDPDKKTLKKADDIVARAGALTSVSNDEVEIAKSRVEDGLISCGDYVISVMTSPDYLLTGVSDEKFANDLCSVIYGEVRQDEVKYIMDDLKNNSRVVAIDKAITSESRKLSASGTPAGMGSVISNVSLESTIDSPEQYTVGIRESSGSYTATGDEVRTDFFVDGSLYYGYLKFTGKSFFGTAFFQIILHEIQNCFLHEPAIGLFYIFIDQASCYDAFNIMWSLLKYASDSDPEIISVSMDISQI